jgi:hypothetical protein
MCAPESCAAPQCGAQPRLRARCRPIAIFSCENRTASTGREKRLSNETGFDAAQTATACRGKAMLAGILAFEVGTVGLSMRRDEILRVGR